MFRAIVAFLLLIALPATVFAGHSDGRGEPPQDHKWWQGQQARELGLGADQSARIEDIYQAAFPRIQAAMAKLEQAQQDLNKLVAGDKTTEMDVVLQLSQVTGARAEVSRQMTLMLFRFYRELTPEQRLKVKAMFDARRERERRGGRRGDPPQRQTRK